MDDRLVKFVEDAYKMALVVNDPLEIKLYASQASGACCYEYERTGDWDALNLWSNEWRDKFASLLEK